MSGVRVAVLDDYQKVAASMADWAGRLPGADVRFFPDHIADQDALVTVLEPFDVVVAMRERTPFPREVLARLPRLRLLVTTGMRNVSVDVAAARERDVVVAGTRGSAGTTAELTWALILGLVRSVAADDARIRAGRWQEAVGLDLDGRTLGVVGLGRLGSRVAGVGRAFGMNVIAWSPNLTPERAAEHGVSLATRAEVFGSADIVTLHLVLSDRSRGLVGEADLRSMKPSAFLVNTSRAGLVDQDALRKALEEGWIAGAGLDVFDVEPLPADHWLRGSPRTLLSPHMGYVTEQTYRIFYADAVEDIAAFLDGSPIRTLDAT
ncbi:D-2-hydroxyacid dehydrogenase family protein [Actinoallomurus bryophytorum]|uniref:Lactate dehydrogenase-like 2-hydroxyacid dehydrogenase n=1 Tax=Actinoallomurus bryophytorum TaxID=1490222 RepID=A0A543CK41_9ACTN|nr:D-2-hydroxyacid dehydrogenase family protein [Actinoallomurus bryophytorum]TQL97410.1 lactate dehydrogenase-like 2-hydroxyacid dehydrogenase [Actinoallomurus bryophytorum]